MIITKPKDERILRDAADISVEILSQLRDAIKEGVTPLELDMLAGSLCNKYGVKVAFKTVGGYKYNTCISVNDVAVHGIPKDIPLKKGDLISIDFGIIYKGMFTDHCWTWSIGTPDAKNEKLLKAGKEAVDNAVSKAVVGNRTGDLGFEMENEAKRNGFNILRMFVGHGIGKSMHQEPEIPAYGRKGSGSLLVDGMVICVECQVVDDTAQVFIDNDGWSAKTQNGGNSVMFEYMVIVRDGQPEVLTDTQDWGYIVYDYPLL
jgi:methionyl aminopeptidase